MRDGGWPGALLKQWKEITILNVICKEHEGAPYGVHGFNPGPQESQHGVIKDPVQEGPL